MWPTIVFSIIFGLALYSPIIYALYKYIKIYRNREKDYQEWKKEYYERTVRKL